MEDRQEAFSRRDNCSTSNSLEERVTDSPYPEDGNDINFEMEARHNENALLTYISSNRLENVGNWVKQTQDVMQQNTENDDGKRKRSDCQDFGKSNDETDSDGSIDEKLKKMKRHRWNLVPLKLKCEWQECSYIDRNVETFVKHVSFHIPNVDLRTSDEGDDVYLCLWDSCDFATLVDKEIVRHVNFHSYHTKLKCIGRKMMKIHNLPPCKFNHDAKNILPDLLSEFSCEWGDCKRSFNNMQVFLYHVAAHVIRMFPTERKKEKCGFSCGWLGCKVVTRTIYALIEHVRVHTQEKLAGCPKCGGLFANQIKFVDHCKRQMNSTEFRCKSCHRGYASERILRDHMRHHVSGYKCPFCDMTCQSPSSTTLHIRYRHLDFKPFKCQYCDYAGRRLRDLSNHLNSHVEEPIFSCEKCEFACRSYCTLKKHVAKVHDKNRHRTYCCHVCMKLFYTGDGLTKHLIKMHNFQWTPGHRRFTYIRSEDEYYRLKPFRLETVEVTQEILQEEMQPETSYSEGRYNFRRRKSQSQNKQAKEAESENTDKKIVIAIDQFDAAGNVVRRQILETEAVPIERLGNPVMSYYSTDHDSSL